MTVATPGNGQVLVAHGVGAGTDLVAIQRVPGTTGERVLLEVVGGAIVVGLDAVSGVAQAELLTRQRQTGVGAQHMAVAPAVGAHFSIQHHALARCGETHRLAVRDDAAANGVTTHRYRRDARIDGDAADVDRQQVGQRRVHVVGTGRADVGAIDGDAQTVVGQAANGWQAGHAASRVHRDAGQ